MKRTLAILLGLCLVNVAVAQDTPEDPGVKPESAEKAAQAKPPKPATHDKAVEILKKVDAATKAVKQVRYKGRVDATGWVVSRVPKVEGTAILAGAFQNNAFEKYFVDVNITMPGQEEARRITTGGNGDLFFMIDWKNKKVHEDLDPAVVGTDGMIAVRSIAMLEFVHPAPFNDEINADRAELLPSQQVDGEDCVVIDVTYAGGQGQSTWYFAKKDWLPRKRVRTIKDPATGESGTITITVTDLEVDPVLSEDVFKSTVPEGFEKTDEFAPNRSRAS